MCVFVSRRVRNSKIAARSSLPVKELLLIIVIIVNFGTCLAGLRFPTRAPGPGVTHNYHRGHPPCDSKAPERSVIYDGVFRPL